MARVRIRRVGMLQAVRAALEQHARAAREAPSRLLRFPVATLMTVGAIGIALALPAMLHLLLVNLEQLTGDWERSAAVTLFLEPGVDEARAAEIAATLRPRPDIGAVELISRAEGLAEFRAYSGLGGALDQLADNPLPVVLVLYPAGAAMSELAAEDLVGQLEALPTADFARVDAQWAQRLQGIAALLRQIALLLGAAFALAVLLVIGNTVRLEIENRRSEIMIMDLVGATRGFIRRPFLYSGAWHGLLGGLVAWLLVTLAIAFLKEPVSRLAALYHTDVTLRGLDAPAALILLGSSTLLGMLGSWVAVGRHLIGVEPD